MNPSDPIAFAANLPPHSHVGELLSWHRARVEAYQRHAGCVGPVGVVGAGMMGTAIAAACAKHQIKVVVYDDLQTARASAPGRITAELCLQTDLTHSAADVVTSRLVTVAAELAALGECGVVVESVPEKLATKEALYKALWGCLAPTACLGTNTSTIPIGRLASAVADPARFCGIHFFHPVRQRSLVEIIRGPKTSDETVATAAALAVAMGKMPIVALDGPGFLVNRLLNPYLSEALQLLLEGAQVDDLEAATTAFGMAMGPVRIMDEIGLDTTLLAGRVLWEAFPDRVPASPLLVTMIKKGRLGRKVARGFFAYSSDTAWQGPPERDAEADAIIAHWAAKDGRFTADLIVTRLLLLMVLEAVRLIEEGRVSDPREIDLAVVFGLGFPAARGGLLCWADTLGAAEIVRRLAPLADLGPRMWPPARLLAMAERGERFYR